MLRYGPEDDQVADFYRTVDARALVVFVHGGYWKAEYDREYARPLARELAAEGFAVLLPEYRRVGGPGGGWPGTLLDVAAAVDTLPALTGVNAPVIVAGHSAGGHLALWTAVRHLLPPGAPGARETPVPLAGVLALAPVADLVEGHRLGVGGGAVGALLGGGPAEQADRYAVADPAALPPPGVRTVVLHGTADDVAPPDLSARYARDGRADLRWLPGSDHFGVTTPGSQDWPAVVAALVELTTP